MGSARWDPGHWASYSAKTVGRSRAHIFRSGGLVPEFDPKRIALRESRDSAPNPNSTAIIAALDVTGSMGMLAETLARKGLGTLFSEILDRAPVPDPHVMAMAIGDAHCDRAPLQVSQFEADIRIAEQLSQLYLEGGGGGNRCESYDLPWYFAAMKTSIDCFEKRRKKGYLFTIGDEEPPEILLADHIKDVIGDRVQGDLAVADVLAMAERQYHVFHVVVEEGSYARSRPDAVMSKWTNLLGQRVLRLSDHSKLAEVIVSAIQVNEGADAGAVSHSWSGATSLVVANAIGGLAAGTAGTDGSGPVRF